MKSKKANFSEWYSEIIADAELCDLRYNVKGFVVFRPNAVIAMKEMYRLWERELEEKGHLPALFPALIPESNFTRESEHVQGFVPEVFWVTGAGDSQFEERLAMRPTSETAMYQMYSLWIQGLKDLPLKIYQSCQVWRCETKATRPFIRSREFYWIEAHNAFATREDSEAQVLEDMEMTENVLHKQFGVPFLFFERPDWDKFPGALHTYAADTLMPDGKVLQLPSTHLLGQNFAKPFDVKYQNEKGELEFVWQTCYVPFISRIFAAIISTHGDDKGLILPFAFAPVQVVIVPILGKGSDEKVSNKCRELEEKMKAMGLRAKTDFSEATPGFKYNHWEMLGTPIRIEIGGREVDAGQLTVARRDLGKQNETIPEANLQAWISNAEKGLIENLTAKADVWFNGMIRKAETMKELSDSLEKGGFTVMPFCSMGMDGKPCADKIKEELHGDVRGALHGKGVKPKAGDKCPACGKTATSIAYIARQY
ncbi:Proline--tRNA ligase [uncultured archaeon]|nr:Proline--tRNA ligase [uncultured archaeon]